MVSNGAEIQIDKGGYTRIHNAILEQLAYHDFTSREYACILYLLRMTYGFSRKECQLSNNEFAKATHLERTAIIKTLRGLVDRNVFIKDDGDPYHAATWSFNKYVEMWDAPTSVKTTTTLETSVETTTSQIDTTSSPQIDTTSSVKTTTTYISAKEIKEKRNGGSEPVSDPPVEQTEKVQPAAPISNSYFGMPVPLRRERVTADGYTQDAAKIGLSPVEYVALVKTLVEIAGWGALIDAGEESKLNYAKQDALKLAILGYAEPDQLKDLAAAYRKTNKWRNTPPQPKDLAEYASQVKAGVIQEGQEPARFQSGREIVTVKFAQPGEDIYA